MVVGLLAVAAASTVGSLYTANQSYKEQKKANALQQRQAELNYARQNRDLVRQKRMSLANAQLNAAGQGVYNSSGALGGQGSIISQGNENISFLDRTRLISDQTSMHLGKAAGYANTSNMFGGISSLALSFASVGYGSKVKADKAVEVKGAAKDTRSGHWETRHLDQQELH